MDWNSLMFPQLNALLASVAVLAAGSAPAFSDEGIEFFEKKVRPLLEQRCVECHSAAKKIKGGLRLDSREGWEKGGDTGAAIVPGDLDKSLVVEALRDGKQALEMA